MSNYVQTTFFAPKDSLLTGNPAKLIKGADVDPELAAISTAIASKYDATNISSAPVLFNDGTVAAPGIAFAADTNTGIYRVGADDIAIATGGVKRLEIASAGAVTITGPTNLTSGGQALALTGLVTGNASSAYLVFNDSGNTRQGYLGKADSTADILMESQTGGLKFYANSTLALTIGSTGNCTIAAPSSGTGLTVNGLASSSYTAQIVAANSTGNSNGAFVRAGTNSGDIAMQVNNAANTATYMQIVGDGSGKLGPTSALGLSWTAAGALTQTGSAVITGGVQFGAPTGGDKGAGTLNVAGGLYINNVAVSTAIGANPTATVGTAAVNGSSANFMRADGAPAINLAMAPAWTGIHIFRGDTESVQIQNTATTAVGQIGTAKAWAAADATTDLGIGAVAGLRLYASNLGRTVATFTSGAQTFGNTTDNPTYSFLGTGATTFSGTVTGLSFIPTSATVPANGLYLAAANTLGFAANSVNIARMTSTAITGLGPVAAAQVDMTPDKGTYTGTLTGCSTSPTGTVSWVRIGNLVIITIPVISATSNATTCTITGSMPASIQPVTTQSSPIFYGTNAGTLSANCQAQVTAASSTITFLTGTSASGWTASGTKVPASIVTTFCYLLT